MPGLPPLAPVPPPEVQRNIPPAEWELYIDAWIMLLGLRVEAPASQLKEHALNDDSTVAFLGSFYRQSINSSLFRSQTAPNTRSLRKLCFLLTRRFLLEVSPTPPELLDWRVLAGMCCCYPSSSALKRLLADAWDKHEDAITSSLEKAKVQAIRDLSSLNLSKPSGVRVDLRLLTILSSVLPGCGQVLMAGSDFLDTVVDAYQAHKREEVRRMLVANVYVGLCSFLKGSKPNLSSLLDQLYGMKASAGVGISTKKEPTLLSEVICSTDFLGRLDRHLSTDVNPQKRGQDLLASLRAYQAETQHLHRRYQKPRKRAAVNKGKGRATEDDLLPKAAEDLHIHKMSLITQVQDLFPDLGTGYIARLLDHYNDDPETIVAHLLDDSLAPELQILDKSESLPTPSPSSNTTHHDPFPPRSPTLLSTTTAPPPQRKNIFDREIDLAELSRSDTTSQHQSLRFGRANPTLTADSLLSDRSNHAAQKAAIMSALATFDSDDDERDDTYDVTDVGGTVDTTVATAEDEPPKPTTASPEETELTLYRAYQSNPALFARDAATRRAQPRAALKRETGMTDEAIEGWAVMVARDPKRLRRLEEAVLDGQGGRDGGLNQPVLVSTAYRRGVEDEDAEGGSASGGEMASMRGRGGGGRGRGRGGRGRGGGRGGGFGGGSAVAGDSQGQNPAAARQRKEENKASRANHNRRQQRAKKVARAGGMVG
ncbi:ASCC2 family CUE domain-containing protein [Aspergillus aculeatinus CBS 121060]|uniref:Uncharacterized protein n=1 Tax=Aspergillus aculeatinus CBS 121060 TaxID=1448322 RepID=A0ACD1GXB0_9EURO|nr:hypothetical protein BO66DRAFT_431613 [Aspergillus aculeatinus CBS 121060]RAH65980.1 hypothetical protein BO66DRAFT_431613 [Aspergillus aculeatinus CBS 121060]